MVTTMFSACSDNGGDWSPVKHPECKEGGYLFAHMTNENYGSLFYSVSRDGYHWETLNNGNSVLPENYIF